MKVIIILSIVGLSQAFVEPSVLFNQAEAYQVQVTALQQDIVTKITSLRSSMSAILKRTSNTTLGHVLDNLLEIFILEEPVRDELFTNNPTMDDCIVNLRNQLNLVTELSGYQSANCIQRFDRSVTALVANAYENMNAYEDLISIIQMLVLNAFSDRNIWTKNQQVSDDFTAKYNQESAQWLTIQAEISNLLATVESDINALNVVLRGCFNDVQTALVPRYNGLIAAAEICREFNS